MSTHHLVELYYSRIWNSGDENMESLLTKDFTFRGSLSAPTHGHSDFLKIVRSVRGSLANYNCEILECVTEMPKSFAQMRFSGVHAADFRGFTATGKHVQWNGAALFTFQDDLISDVWVLSDLVGLDDVLRRNALE